MKKTVKMDAELHADVKELAAKARISIEQYIDYAVTVSVVRARKRELRDAAKRRATKEKP